jgi:hypothetical protein
MSYEIILQYLLGELRPPNYDLDALADYDATDRRYCEHQEFALAILLLYVAANETEAGMRRFTEYVTTWRRERYPLLPHFEPLLIGTDARQRF